MGGVCRRERPRHASAHESWTKVFPLFRMSRIRTVIAPGNKKEEGVKHHNL